MASYSEAVIVEFGSIKKSNGVPGANADIKYASIVTPKNVRINHRIHFKAYRNFNLSTSFLYFAYTVLIILRIKKAHCPFSKGTCASLFHPISYICHHIHLWKYTSYFCAITGVSQKAYQFQLFSSKMHFSSFTYPFTPSGLSLPHIRRLLFSFQL